jgi:hypothetical protein
LKQTSTFWMIWPKSPIEIFKAIKLHGSTKHCCTMADMSFARLGHGISCVLSTKQIYAQLSKWWHIAYVLCLVIQYGEN